MSRANQFIGASDETLRQRLKRLNAALDGAEDDWVGSPRDMLRDRIDEIEAELERRGNRSH